MAFRDVGGTFVHSTYKIFENLKNVCRVLTAAQSAEKGRVSCQQMAAATAFARVAANSAQTGHNLRIFANLAQFRIKSSRNRKKITKIHRMGMESFLPKVGRHVSHTGLALLGNKVEQDSVIGNLYNCST